MKLKHCISTVVLMVTLLTVEPKLIQEQDIVDDPRVHAKFCSKHKHLPLSKFTCCNGSALTNWIDENYWTGCQRTASTGDEGLLDSIWRVYTCALSKSLGTDQKTISLVKFTNIMTANYPERIKESISGSIKELGSKSTSENSDWLTSDVSLTDLSNINKIRAQYYDVERQVCSDEKVEFAISSESLHTCNTTQEVSHRFGSCCINGSLPFRPYANSPSKRLNSLATCNRTMERMLAKFNNDKTRLIVLKFCRFSCYLIDNSFLTMDDFLKLRQESDIPPMEIIVNSTYPYFPVKYLNDLETTLTRVYNGTQMMEVSKNSLTRLNVTNVSPEDFYACIALRIPHDWLAKMVREGRFSIAELLRMEYTDAPLILPSHTTVRVRHSFSCFIWKLKNLYCSVFCIL